jgi:DNA-binding MarR family transcriptional regulator
MQHQDHDPEQLLFFLIKRTTRAFIRRLSRDFAEAGHDVTIAQWMILNRLWYQDGRRQQDLADLVHRDKTSITRVIDSMEERDLVVRILDESDRRQKLIYLTNKGKKLQEELTQIAEKTSAEVQKEIEPEHLDILGKTLAEICNNLSDS